MDWALNWRNHSHQEAQDIYGIELNRKVRFLHTGVQKAGYYIQMQRGAEFMYIAGSRGRLSLSPQEKFMEVSSFVTLNILEEETMVGIFCAHHQHLHTSHKGRLCHLSLTLKKKCLSLSHGSKAPGHLTWQAHVSIYIHSRYQALWTFSGTYTA